MVEFKDREEYEKWKARRLRDLRGEQDPSADGEEEPDAEGGGEGRKGLQPSPQGSGGRDLADPGDLFRRAWEMYKRRVGVIISLYLLSFLFFLVIFCFCMGAGYLFSVVIGKGREALSAAGAITGIIGGSIFFTWGLAGATYAVADEGLGVGAALRRGWPSIWSFMWMISLVGYIIPGGFLLFIVPGIIFAVWFSFSQFIFVSEGRKGMDCLLRSKEYVRDRWFDVFLRLFLVWIASVVAGSIPLIGPILSLLFVPYLMIFIWLLYKDVKNIKGEVTYSTAASEKLKWIGAATVGYFALPLFALFILGTSIMTLPLLFLKRCLLHGGY